MQELLTHPSPEFVVAFLSAGGVLAAIGVRAVFALGGASLLLLVTVGWLAFRPVGSSEPLTALPEPANAG